MAAPNTNPIYTITPKNPWGKVTAADTGTDGTGANVVLIWTADATNGGFLQKITLQPISTSGSTTTNAAVARFYLNNGSSVGTAANNILFAEVGLSAISVNTSATTATISPVLPCLFQVQAGYAIYIGITSMAANTQWNAWATSGNY